MSLLRATNLSKYMEIRTEIISQFEVLHEWAKANVTHGKSEVVNQYQKHQKKYPMNISKELGFDDYFFSC